MLLPYLHYRPALAGAPQLAARAAVIGRTTAGRDLIVRNYAALRADGERISLGARVFFGERACAHIADGIYPTEIADDVTVGRYGLVHACKLAEGVVVAEAGVVMDAAEVGPYALIAPGALVPPRKKLAGGWVYEGNPAVPVREIPRQELQRLAASIRAGTPAPAAAARSLPPLDNTPYLPAGASGDGLHAQAGRSPRIERAYVAPTALLAGDVHVGVDAGVFFGCVLLAGAGRIVVGARSNVQDGTIVALERGELLIAPDVTIGHNVRMGSGSVAQEALIGMGSTVGEGVVVERGACIAAGAWVEPGTVVKAGWIWAGRPARPFREMKPAEREGFAKGREVYVGYSRAYRGAESPRQAG